MLVKGTSQHDDVVEVDQALRPLEASQDEVHQPLEGCGGVAQPKWHNSELEEALSCAERGLRPVSLVDLHLPIAAEEVERAKPLGSGEGVEGGVDARQGVCILPRRVV